MQLYRPQLHSSSLDKHSQRTVQTYSQLTTTNQNYNSNINSQQKNITFNNLNHKRNIQSPHIPIVSFTQPKKQDKTHQPSNQHQKLSSLLHPFIPLNSAMNQNKLNIQTKITNQSSSFINKDYTTNFQIQTLVNAMNNSSLRQMSQGENIKPSDMMALLSQTIQQINRFSMLYEPKTEDLKHYFRIVEVNESQLFQNQFPFSLSLMDSCSQSKNNRKKYQLLITLDGKQIKFQSMKNRDLHFNINLDTVQCEFLQFSTINERQTVVKFRVGQKIIPIFINESCLPFHLKNSNSQITKQYTERTAKQIGKYLKKAIQKSRGAQFKLTNLIAQDQKFFLVFLSIKKNNYATQQQFTQFCQTGDILLFKDRHTFAKIQRAITNSEYDHIAFVYRSQKYGICLIESSSGFGVSLTVWTQLVRKHWFRGIDTISWRRLLIHNKPDDFEKKVEDFIAVNKNKKYGISFSKLLTFQSSIKTQQQQKNRTYFCSQLVAQLYKQLGLLDQKVSSTQYWPKHFSQKGHLQMLKNSALDKERILVFQQQILKQNYKGYQ